MIKCYIHINKHSWRFVIEDIYEYLIQEKKDYQSYIDISIYKA